MTRRTKRRPIWLCHECHPDVIELYDWMLANNVDEWLPAGFAVTVTGNAVHGTLTYESYRWRRTWWGRSKRGWDSSQIRRHMLDSPTVERTVPLLAPLTDRIRQICFNHGHQLIEWSNPPEPLWPNENEGDT